MERLHSRTLGCPFVFGKAPCETSVGLWILFKVMPAGSPVGGEGTVCNRGGSMMLHAARQALARLKRPIRTMRA